MVLRILRTVTKQPPASGIEVLSSEQCWHQLRQVSVGRLAVWAGDHPDIFPINYVVDHGTIVFRSGEGTKLDLALAEAPVALEADGVNADTGVAWSVVVKGQAASIKAAEEVLDTVGLLLFPWQSGRKDHFVRVVPTSITGRRFTVTPPATWWSSLNQAPRAGME